MAGVDVGFLLLTCSHDRCLFVRLSLLPVPDQLGSPEAFMCRVVSASSDYFTAVLELLCQQEDIIDHEQFLLIESPILFTMLTYVLNTYFPETDINDSCLISSCCQLSTLC